VPGKIELCLSPNLATPIELIERLMHRVHNVSDFRPFQFFPKRVSRRNIPLLSTPRMVDPIEIEQIFIAYDYGNIYGITFNFGHTQRVQPTHYK